MPALAAANTASAAETVTLGEIAALRANVAQLTTELAEVKATVARLCKELGVADH